MCLVALRQHRPLRAVCATGGGAAKGEALERRRHDVGGALCSRARGPCVYQAAVQAEQRRAVACAAVSRLSWHDMPQVVSHKRGAR